MSRPPDRMARLEEALRANHRARMLSGDAWGNAPAGWTPMADGQLVALGRDDGSLLPAVYTSLPIHAYARASGAPWRLTIRIGTRGWWWVVTAFDDQLCEPDLDGDDPRCSGRADTLALAIDAALSAWAAVLADPTSDRWRGAPAVQPERPPSS